MVKWLSEQRADNREGNKDGTSPLGVDAQYGHLEVAKWLKGQGVDVGEKDSNGWTPLHHALRNGQLEVVKWLKEQGADICEKTKYGSSAMDLASEWTFGPRSVAVGAGGNRRRL